ncbi:MAG TPA: hypothetical protein VFU60_03670 [Ktedonobacterales bacterium]|nr:hypothetical protein [Ktedonobacterales bacterium]
MSTSRRQRLVAITGISLCLITGLVVALVNKAQASPLSGAIFTTDASGQLVNGNIYSDKSDVYLDGGPQNCASGSGLPDGNYYFQVTDPSGSTLLSSDAISEREVAVAADVFSTYVGSHATGAGPCGSTTVALAPYDDSPNNGGEYKVWVTPVDSYHEGQGTFGFLSDQSKTDNFKVIENASNLCGYKFFDANTDGAWEQGTSEPGIAGWQITETDADASFIVYTNQQGQYCFPTSSEASTITEGTPAGGWFPGSSWIHTTATSGSVDSFATTGPNFGNVCVGKGGGLTLGFWSNKNGQKLITSSDLAFLDGLNLVNASGAAFDPSTTTSVGGPQLASWLLGANATNMAYMLSAQLATMELNVRHGFVSGNALIYAPGATSADAAGFATVSDVMGEANTDLGVNPITLSGNPDRTYQEALKNALDNANNNKTFVQAAGSCPTPTSWQ